tara:strand:+ start:187 stop:636 length:450 start_codon:yes stop_codon:yes gene_type:complete
MYLLNNFKNYFCIFLLIFLLQACQTTPDMDDQELEISSFVVSTDADQEPVDPEVETVPNDRSLIVMVDNYKEENPLVNLFLGLKLPPDSLMLAFTKSLNSKNPSPLYVSKSIVQTFNIYRQIFSDTVTLGMHDFETKYNNLKYSPSDLS